MMFGSQEEKFMIPPLTKGKQGFTQDFSVVEGNYAVQWPALGRGF